MVLYLYIRTNQTLLNNLFEVNLSELVSQERYDARGINLLQINTILSKLVYEIMS